MSDTVIERATQVLNQSVVRQSVNGDIDIAVYEDGSEFEETLAQALDDANLLVTPEHDRAVAAKALRDMRDEMSRWEGWDTRDIGHAFLSESVLDALDDAAARIEREGGGDV